MCCSYGTKLELAGDRFMNGLDALVPADNEKSPPEIVDYGVKGDVLTF